MNVDPELRKRVEQIKSSPVQLYREAGDYSNRELVEGILVSPDDIAAIEAVARATIAPQELWNTVADAVQREFPEHCEEAWTGRGLHAPDCVASVAADIADDVLDRLGLRFGLVGPFPTVEEAEAAHQRMVQPDHYQRWER